MSVIAKIRTTLLSLTALFAACASPTPVQQQAEIITVAGYEIVMEGPRETPEFIKKVNELKEAESQFQALLNSDDEDEVYIAELGQQMILEAVNEIREADLLVVRGSGDDEQYIRSAFSLITNLFSLQANSGRSPYSMTEISSARENTQIHYITERELDLNPDTDSWLPYSEGDRLKIGYYRMRVRPCANSEDGYIERLLVQNDPYTRVIEDNCE